MKKRLTKAASLGVEFFGGWKAVVIGSIPGVFWVIRKVSNGRIGEVWALCLAYAFAAVFVFILEVLYRWSGSRRGNKMECSSGPSQSDSEETASIARQQWEVACWAECVRPDREEHQIYLSRYGWLVENRGRVQGFSKRLGQKIQRLRLHRLFAPSEKGAFLGRSDCPTVRLEIFLGADGSNFPKLRH
jgi:hypothetical protein